MNTNKNNERKQRAAIRKHLRALRATIVAALASADNGSTVNAAPRNATDYNGTATDSEYAHGIEYISYLNAWISREDEKAAYKAYCEYMHDNAAEIRATGYSLYMEEDIPGYSTSHWHNVTFYAGRADEYHQPGTYPQPSDDHEPDPEPTKPAAKEEKPAEPAEPAKRAYTQNPENQRRNYAETQTGYVQRCYYYTDPRTGKEVCTTARPAEAAEAMQKALTLAGYNAPSVDRLRDLLSACKRPSYTEAHPASIKRAQAIFSAYIDRLRAAGAIVFAHKNADPANIDKDAEDSAKAPNLAFAVALLPHGALRAPDAPYSELHPYRATVNSTPDYQSHIVIITLDTYGDDGASANPRRHEQRAKEDTANPGHIPAHTVVTVESDAAYMHAYYTGTAPDGIETDASGAEADKMQILAEEAARQAFRAPLASWQGYSENWRDCDIYEPEHTPAAYTVLVIDTDSAQPDPDEDDE